MDLKAFRLIQKPISIFLLFLWIMNDLFLKSIFKNFWTGKLSDLSSLFIFPIFITAIVSFFYKKSEEIIFRFSLFFTGILFCFINSNQDFNDFYTYGVYGNLFGNENIIRGRADLTDLICIPILYVSYLFYKNTENKEYYPKEIIFGILTISFSFFATVNTSCGETCGGRDDSLLLFLLSYPQAKDPLPMNLNPESPADSAKFLQGDIIEFKWSFQGKEATPDYMSKYPYGTPKTEGGKFIGYRIQIFSTPYINYESKPVFESTDTTNLSLLTQINISQGTYYWIPVLVFEYGEQKVKLTEPLNRKYRTIHLNF